MICSVVARAAVACSARFSAMPAAPPGVAADRHRRGSTRCCREQARNPASAVGRARSGTRTGGHRHRRQLDGQGQERRRPQGQFGTHRREGHPTRPRVDPGAVNQSASAGVNHHNAASTFRRRVPGSRLARLSSGVRILGDRASSQDIAQESLARAYQRWKRIGDYHQAWVARVAGNLAIDEIRRRRPSPIDARRVDTEVLMIERLDLQRLCSICRGGNEMRSCCDTSPISAKPMSHRCSAVQPEPSSHISIAARRLRLILNDSPGGL